jgi:hypothetical protein
MARGRAVFDSQTKFQSENLMADVYLGIAIAGANALIVMAVAIAFSSYERPLLSWRPL